MLKIKEIEKQLQEKKLQSENEKKIIEDRQNKTFQEIKQNKSSGVSGETGGDSSSSNKQSVPI